MCKLGLILIGAMFGAGSLCGEFTVQSAVWAAREARIESASREYCIRYRHCARFNEPSPRNSETAGAHLIEVRRLLIENTEKPSLSTKERSELETAIKRLDQALRQKASSELTY